MLVEFGFVLPGNRCVGVQRRAVFDALSLEVDDHMPARPVDVGDPVDRKQNRLAGKPVAGIDDMIEDSPAVGFRNEVLDPTQFAVPCRDAISPNLTRVSAGRPVRGREE